MSKATSDELRLLIRSGWRLIVLETFEEDRALALLEKVEELGARYGIGRGIHLGDTIIGTKGRVAFGLIGIFIGPVVLAVAYTLLQAWLGDQTQEPGLVETPNTGGEKREA